VAPRAYWKGYLKLSLVSCPVALFPASSEREKISFNQINKKTGNRIRYRKIDAETEEEVYSSDIIKGYEVGKGQYIEIEPEELEAIAIESKRTIEIDEFVPKQEIDELYLNSPYYLAPDGEVGQQAFAVMNRWTGRHGLGCNDIRDTHPFALDVNVALLDPNGERDHIGACLHEDLATGRRQSINGRLNVREIRSVTVRWA
jgi:hypothetical protein